MTSLLELPHEVIVSSLCSRFPCRDQQIRSLATLLSIHAAPSRNIVLYGLEATGKTTITKAVLEALSIRQAPGTGITELGDLGSKDRLRYAIVKSAECITGRHLLEQTLGAVAKAVDWNGKVSRCENIAQLVVEIGRLLEGSTQLDKAEAVKHNLVVVFHGIDRQRDAPPTLLPALARLGEIISNITTIFIVTAPRPNFLHLQGVPHIHFPAYAKTEILQIISLVEPTPSLPGGLQETKNVWTRFCSAVWDSLAKHSGRDVLSFRSVCCRLWPSFIGPILDGTLLSNQFSRLLVANRSLLQNDFSVVPSIVSEDLTMHTAIHRSEVADINKKGIGTQLPFFSRLLLVAAYLASFNPPSADQLFFAKSTAAKRRKKGGGTALPRGRPGVTKHRKISRKLLGPQAFLLERMLAIFHAIKADADDGAKYGRGNGGENGAADIQMAIATLASLRFLTKMGGPNAADTLDGSSKWKVAVEWEVVRGIARSVGVEAEDYFAD